MPPLTTHPKLGHVSPLDQFPSAPQGKCGWPWIETPTPLPATMPDGTAWPRISIVTPSYNQAPFLEETIRSVLLQGYPNLEYIVMDGGSTDGSIEIIERYRPRLSYVHIGPDGGQSAAIGEGFRHATGEIIAWLNSDDRYQPGAFARVATFFASNPRVVFASGDIYNIDASSRIIKRIYAVPLNRFLLVNRGSYVPQQQGSFWRRSTYLQVGGMNSAFRFCMDRDLFIRLTNAGQYKRIAGPPLADFRLHEEAKTSTIQDVRKRESMLLIERYGTPWARKNPWLLKLLARLWYRPVGLRRRLNHRFGWEL